MNLAIFVRISSWLQTAPLGKMATMIWGATQATGRLLR